jgi:predicted  nucleic acid-binding Zn-ribbon protein
MSLREELEKLSRLQEIDLKIDRARNQANSAPAILQALSDELAAAQKAHATLLAGIEALEKQKRSLETDIMMDRDRIKNIEERLGSITNNKEYHAVSKEADKAKKLITDREKMILDIGEKVAAQQALVAESQSRVDEVASRHKTKQDEVGSAIGETEKEIASYADDRGSVAGSIQQAIISRYIRTRTRYSDALAVANGGRCTSCNVALPPQMYIQVQRAVEMLTCPSCQRILFYKLQ